MGARKMTHSSPIHQRGSMRDRPSRLLNLAEKLNAPAMISMHYPPLPRNGTGTSISTVEQRNSCIYLLYSKLGLASGELATPICWMERIFVKTPLSARKYDASQLYNRFYSRDVFPANDQFYEEVLRRSAYRISLMVEKDSVKEGIKRASSNPDLTFFTIPLESDEFTPISWIHIYRYHPEPTMRGELPEFSQPYRHVYSKEVLSANDWFYELAGFGGLITRRMNPDLSDVIR